MNDDDVLIIIGSSHQEGAAAPSAVAYDASVGTNYTQVFRNTIDITGTAAATRMRWGKPLVEMKRETLELHSIEMERAFLFGAGLEDTNGTHPQRTTKGLLNFITTNVTDWAGSVTKAGWHNMAESLFKNGQPEKLLLAGNRFINVINQMAENQAQITTEPTSETYGVRMLRWTTAFGDILIKQHPLLSQTTEFYDWGFFIDPKNIVYRYLQGRDTTFRENIQNPDTDSEKHEFRTECGLELDFEETHAVSKNGTAFVP
jgi:hypothetical protein